MNEATKIQAEATMAGKLMPQKDSPMFEPRPFGTMNMVSSSEPMGTRTVAQREAIGYHFGKVSVTKRQEKQKRNGAAATDSQPRAGSGPEYQRGLPSHLKAGLENISGRSMDDVQVHYNSKKPAELDARAYTQGPNIYLGPGSHDSLEHEVGHVVQQKIGEVKPQFMLRGQRVNADAGLEKEADRIGRQASGNAGRAKNTHAEYLPDVGEPKTHGEAPEQPIQRQILNKQGAPISPEQYALLRSKTNRVYWAALQKIRDSKFIDITAEIDDDKEIQSPDQYLVQLRHVIARYNLHHANPQPPPAASLKDFPGLVEQTTHQILDDDANEVEETNADDKEHEVWQVNELWGKQPESDTDDEEIKVEAEDVQNTDLEISGIKKLVRKSRREKLKEKQSKLKEKPKEVADKGMKPQGIHVESEKEFSYKGPNHVSLFASNVYYLTPNHDFRSKKLNIAEGKGKGTVGKGAFVDKLGKSHMPTNTKNWAQSYDPEKGTYSEAVDVSGMRRATSESSQTGVFRWEVDVHVGAGQPWKNPKIDTLMHEVIQKGGNLWHRKYAKSEGGDPEWITTAKNKTPPPKGLVKQLKGNT
ncbi:MAG: DUF4157 domain-containing protein [Cyanobacteria bacterium P01_D01_bin.44]